MVGKSLVINVLGVSKLLYLARVLVTPRWVIDRFNSLIWNFLWGSKIEPVARKTLHCPIDRGVSGSLTSKSRVGLYALLRVYPSLMILFRIVFI